LRLTHCNLDRFQEFFKTKDEVTVRNITMRFQAIAKECATQSTGNASYSCTDTFKKCGTPADGIIAYTHVATNAMIMCPMYFQLELLTKKCHGYDQSTTVVHELTHAEAVFYPKTDDYAYGYPQSFKLSKDKAFKNAETYELFAQCKWPILMPFKPYKMLISFSIIAIGVGC